MNGLGRVVLLKHRHTVRNCWKSEDKTISRSGTAGVISGVSVVLPRFDIM